MSNIEIGDTGRGATVKVEEPTFNSVELWQGAKTGQELSSTYMNVSADRVLGASNQVELIQTKEAPPSREEVDRMTRALLSDARSGERWSQDSIQALQKLFASEKAVPGATPQQIAEGLAMVGGSINRRVRPELENIPGRLPKPISLAISRNSDGSLTYYAMLSKDEAALARNKEDFKNGKTSDTVIKLGTFRPANRNDV